MINLRSALNTVLVLVAIVTFGVLCVEYPFLFFFSIAVVLALSFVVLVYTIFEATRFNKQVSADSQKDSKNE